jgi:hypothetical protein
MAMLDIKDFYINDAIKRICNGSKVVDKLRITSADDIMIAVFETQKGIKIAKLTKDEIKERVEKDNVQNENIKDFVISLIREKLVTDICFDSLEEIRKDIEKYITINQTVTDILNKLFPDQNV